MIFEEFAKICPVFLAMRRAMRRARGLFYIRIDGACFASDSRVFVSFSRIRASRGPHQLRCGHVVFEFRIRRNIQPCRQNFEILVRLVIFVNTVVTRARKQKTLKILCFVTCVEDYHKFLIQSPPPPPPLVN